jgi:hypothetical protein
MQFPALDKAFRAPVMQSLRCCAPKEIITLVIICRQCKIDQKSAYRRYGIDRGKDAILVFAGDSPNDEPMFARFPRACGVANVTRYRDMMRRLPAFVASREGGAGFAEIAAAILEKRAQ